MINNRPSNLTKMSFYEHLPRAPFSFNATSLPSLLNSDIFELCGILPVTLDIGNLCPEGLSVQPPQKVFDYYHQIGMKFQMIFVVANFYDLRFEKGIVRGRPYCLSLMPASKRGRIDHRDAKFAALLRYEDFESKGLIYLDYDPFEGAYGVFGRVGDLMGEKGLHTCTDSIGFVINAYLLATHYNQDQVLMSDLPSIHPFLQDKYRKYRLNTYFKPFSEVLPRKVWGADSPIELFLIQALAAEGVYPVIQTLILENGETFPSLHDMILSQQFDKDHQLITEVDLFLPEKNIAVFCDSVRYHRSKKNRQKDNKIDERLATLGIKSVRIKGSDIVNNLEATTKDLLRQL